MPRAGLALCATIGVVLALLAAAAVWVLVDDLSQPDVDAPIMSAALVVVLCRHAWLCIAAARVGRGVGWRWAVGFLLMVVGLPVAGYGLDQYFFWIGESMWTLLISGAVLFSAGTVLVRQDGIRRAALSALVSSWSAA